MVRLKRPQHNFMPFVAPTKRTATQAPTATTVTRFMFIGRTPLKRALITGITGQDGSYLAEYLLTQGYEVWGLVRGQENPKISAMRELIPDLQFVGGDLLDQGSLISALETVQPDEVYNLA